MTSKALDNDRAGNLYSGQFRFSKDIRELGLNEDSWIWKLPDPFGIVSAYLSGVEMA